jgi:flagellar hook-associated protein 2
MGRIQSSVGLISGVPIEETVNKLMELNALPRTRLVNRNDGLTKEQTAITSLTSLVIGVQLTTDRLGQASLYNATRVTSSKTDLVTARSTGSPAKGSYNFVPVRQAASQQLTSSLFASTDQKLSAGTINIQTGGFLDQSVELDTLNGGTGVARGFIKITDKSGTTREIDLRFAQTATDVVNSINSTSGLSVVAKLDGDKFVLTDVSVGGTGSLKVEEVGSGSTARNLGFVNTSESGSVATGASLTKLASSTALRNLRDGLGLEIPNGSPALKFTLADGSEVNFTTSLDGKKSSLGQLLNELNTAGTGKFNARISTDGTAVEIQDLTTGSGTLAISSPNGNLATQLGLTGTASSGIIKGGRLQAGLSDTLLSTLNGGRGLGELGSVTITDRLGGTDTISLSSATTLGEVVKELNNGALNASFRVQLNQTKTGIEIVDTSNGTGSLQVQNGDSKNSASALGIASSVPSGTIDSGSLRRQFVGKNTSLEEFLGGGQTLAKSAFKITDSSGQSSTFNVVTRNPKSIGDVIDGINALGLGVQAKINQKGDGILLVDTAGGSGKLTVSELGTGTAAAQLKIVGTASDLQVDGSTVSGIDGSKSISLTTTADTTVADLVKQINELPSGSIRANIVNLGSSGVRLQLNGRFTGLQSRVAVSSNLGIDFSQTSEARDALVSFGADQSGGGVLASSRTNTFSNLVDGLEITLSGTSTSAVTVDVAENSESLTKQVEAFVEQFNKLRTKYDELTVFDANSNQVGLLFGSGVAIRVEQAYSRLLTASIRSGATGTIRSLTELGLKLTETGKLSLDKEKLQAAVSANPAAVQDFFTNTTNGFSKQAKGVSDSLAGVENGTLISRNKSLQTTIEQNANRISGLDLRLSKQRERLLKQFYGMEQAISKLQQSVSSINSIQNLSASSSR